MSYSFESLGEDDVLTRSRFHKILVAFHRPDAWPDAVVWLIAMLLAVLASTVWGSLSTEPQLGLIVFVLQLAFFGADALMLNRLSHRQISFAGWKAQFFALALPRLGATLIIALIGLAISWAAGIGLLLMVQFVGTLALYRGAFVEPAVLGLSQLKVVVNGWLPGTAPIRLLHVSDIHLERLSVRESQLLALIAAQRPDAILLTGDYVNLSFQLDAETHDQLKTILGQLAAPLGVYAILGSPPVDLHDTVPQLFDQLPVKLLRNEAWSISCEDGRQITLLGLDCHHDITRDRVALQEAAGSVSPNGPRILMFHSPELMPDAVAAGIDLYLCGHTHGGQVRLPVIGPLLTMSALGRRYSMGHYHEHRTHLYISRGIGFEGLGAPRVRLLCPPEVLLVTLVPKDDGPRFGANQTHT